MKYFHCFLLFIFLTFLTLPLLAQDDEDAPKGYMAILAGPSIPTGQFSDNDWNNEKSGFGKNGYNYTLMEFGFKFIPNFGLAAAIKGAVIPRDVEAIANGYAQEYGGQFTVKSTRWGYTGFFAGPFVSIPSKYVDVDFKFMTGMIVANFPEMTVSRDNQVAGQQSATGSSLSFSGGVGARVHILKKFSLVAQGEYFLARPGFQVEFYDTNGTTENVNGAQLFTMFNFSFGIAYRLF